MEVESAEIGMRVIAMEARMCDVEEAISRVNNLVTSKLSEVKLAEMEKRLCRLEDELSKLQLSKTAEMLEKTLRVLNDEVFTLSKTRLPDVEHRLSETQRRLHIECGDGMPAITTPTTRKDPAAGPPPHDTLHDRLKRLEGFVSEILATLHGHYTEMIKSTAETKEDLKELNKEQEVSEILATLHGYYTEMMKSAAATKEDLKELIEEQEDAWAEQSPQAPASQSFHHQPWGTMDF